MFSRESLPAPVGFGPRSLVHGNRGARRRGRSRRSRPGPRPRRRRPAPVEERCRSRRPFQVGRSSRRPTRMPRVAARRGCAPPCPPRERDRRVGRPVPAPPCADRALWAGVIGVRVTQSRPGRARRRRRCPRSGATSKANAFGLIPCVPKRIVALSSSTDAGCGSLFRFTKISILPGPPASPLSARAEPVAPTICAADTSRARRFGSRCCPMVSRPAVPRGAGDGTCPCGCRTTISAFGATIRLRQVVRRGQLDVRKPYSRRPRTTSPQAPSPARPAGDDDCGRRRGDAPACAQVRRSSAGCGHAIRKWHRHVLRRGRGRSARPARG